MKKIILLFIAVFLLFSQLFAQGFAGINAGNYAGITGVMLQPASIVDSRFKFDINVFSTDARYSNNYLLLDRNVLLKLNKNNFDDYPTFRSKYLTEAKLAPGEKVFFNISNRTQLPLSFMVTLNDKSAFAINLQSRTMVQGRNINQEFASVAFNSFPPQPLNNPSIDASGIALRSLSWVEAGLTYGRVLLNSNHHFLKGAITGKYLGGVSSFILSSNNLRMQVNNDSTFNFTADRVNYDHNKNADVNRVIDNRFKPDANTVGFDAGLVYEYRGKLNNIKYIRNDDEKSYEVKRRDLNKYIFKLGVSLLDADMFRFKKENNVNSFAANISNWDIRNANYSSIREFDTALANRVSALPNDPREYNMYLPGALSVQMDIRFVKGLYLNAVAYRPLKMGSEDGTRFNNYGYYTITPRYERRHFGIYVPYTFSDKEAITKYRDNWLGLTLRAGPVFLGSSNLGSMLFNKELKAADFFVGLKIGFTYGKPSKITRLLADTDEPSYEMLQMEQANKERVAIHQLNKARENADTFAANRIVVDYSKGQIYNDGKTQQIIVVNNHYHYGNMVANHSDSINYVNNLRREVLQKDSVAIFNLIHKRRTDSLNMIFKDSLLQKREQLDSLINNLNNLRQRLDSTNKDANSSGYNYQLKKNESTLLNSTAADSLSWSENLKRVDTIFTNLKTADKLDSARMTQSESAKKKVMVSPVERNQISTANNDASFSGKRENVETAYANDAKRLQQQTIDVNDYERYLQLSQRLNNDIERLERQIAYNRTVANNTGQQQNDVTPLFYERPPATTNFYPVTVQDNRIREKDTIFLRDSFYVTKTDTIINIIPTTNTITISKEKIIAEKIDYKKLPAENMLFAVGQATIRKVYLEKLDYFADVLQQNPALTIIITGHTDKTGSISINEILSLKRAKAVESFFLQKGINKNRIQVIAVASEDPLVAGNTTNAQMQNRRVEIKIF